MRRLAFVAALLALPACVSAVDCAASIPADLRADTIRYALERGLCRRGDVPTEDLSLGLGAGRPYEALDEERRRQVALHATGYGACLHERVDRQH
jgi:hypothetical protein